MEKQAKVTVKRTGQLNGSKIINKTVTTDASMAKQFTGGNRYDVIEDFVRTHYPGMKFNPKNFSANVNYYDVGSNDGDDDSESGKKSFLGRLFGGGNRSDDDDDDDDDEDDDDNNAEVVKKDKIIIPPIAILELTEDEKLLKKYREEKDNREAKLRDEEYSRVNKLQEEQYNREHKLNLDRINLIAQERLKKETESAIIKIDREETRINRINSLIEFDELDSAESIENHLEKLLISISGFSLSKELDNENFYVDKMISKYKISLEKLKILSNDPETLKYLTRKYQAIRRKRFLVRIMKFIKSLN